MPDFKLNCSSIERAWIEGKITQEVISDLIQRPDLIKRIRYTDSVGKPWGEWDRSCELLENIASDIKFFQHEHYFATCATKSPLNCIYVFSKYFSGRPEQLLNLYSKLQIGAAVAVLSREVVAEAILSHVLRSPICLQSTSPKLFLLLMLRATSLRILSIPDELELITFYLTLPIAKGDDFSVCLEALKQRASALGATPEASKAAVGPCDKKARLAIFVCGQCRAIDVSFPALTRLFSQIKVPFDVYISTWADIGGLVAEPAKVNRHVSNDVIDRLISSGMSLESIAELVTATRLRSSGKISADRLIGEFSSISGKIMVNVKSDCEFPYNEMSNPEKMYYHNSFWPRTLGAKYFVETYSHVLKVRPDSDVNFDGVDFSENRFVITEEAKGWIFREWGFGLGDQLLFGDCESVIPLLDVYRGDLLSRRIVSDVFEKPLYQGHMNIGLCAWLNGINVKENTSFRYRLLNLPKLGVDAFGAVLK